MTSPGRRGDRPRAFIVILIMTTAGCFGRRLDAHRADSPGAAADGWAEGLIIIGVRGASRPGLQPPGLEAALPPSTDRRRSIADVHLLDGRGASPPAQALPS